MQRAFRKNIRIGSGILLAIAMAGCGKDNPAKNNGTGPLVYRWDFNTLSGWIDDSQNTGGPDNYRIEDGTLRIRTRPNTWDRAKVRTEEKKYKAGLYTWRVFVPIMGAGDQASIGAFLYHSDSRELDFEIGYGKSADRKLLKASEDDLIVFTTCQADPSKSTKHLLKRDRWYDLSIRLDLTGEPGEQKYRAAWLVDSLKIEEMQLGFSLETPFYIYCSVENLQFLGDHIPYQENFALFDFVEHAPLDTTGAQ
jgi:hypothetical protein